MNKTIATLPLLALLAACGGSNRPEVAAISALPLEDINALATSLTADYGDAFENGDYNGAGDLPTEGSADYAGVIGLGGTGLVTGDSDPITVGQLSVAVDFATNDIAGTASDFYDTEDETQNGGEMDLDAEIDRTTGEFSGTLVGAFVDLNGELPDVPVDVDITGGFAGNGAEAIIGSGTGTITFEDDRGTLGVGVVFGAEQ